MRGSGEAALAELDRAVELDPDRLEYRIRRAEVLIRLGQHESARGELEAAARIDPASPRWRYRLATLATKSGDVERAMALLDEAVGLDPDYIPARIERGGLRFERQDLDGAMKDYEHVLGIAPDQLEALLGAFPILLARDQKNDAAGALLRAGEVDPRHPLQYLYRALLALDQGLHEEAVLNMGVALEMDPWSTTSGIRRGTRRIPEG